MNEDATQLEAIERLEPVLLERRREWRMLHPVEGGAFTLTRIAELVETAGEVTTVLGYVERPRSCRSAPSC
jgi:hypothetical protein